MSRFQSFPKLLPGYRLLALCALFLGLAPFYPQPHLLEKLRMLLAGTLNRPIDIFDLFWHGWPFILLAVRALLDLRRGGTA
jgi:hypothetical protein